LQTINALPTQMPTQPTMQTNTLDLNDIHVPEQISNYPIAYGWWVLGIIVIVLAVISILKIKKNSQFNRIKKQALLQLKRNPTMTTSDTVTLLKWAAMHYFSRADLAKLFGKSLQSFLIAQLPIKHQETFSKLSESAFSSQYKANNDKIDRQTDADFYQAATIWLTNALPPKTVKIINKKQGANI